MIPLNRIVMTARLLFLSTLFIHFAVMGQIDPLTVDKVKNIFAKDTLVKTYWFNYFFGFDSPYANTHDKDCRPAIAPLPFELGTMYVVRKVTKGDAGQPGMYAFGLLYVRGEKRAQGLTVNGPAQQQPTITVLHDHFLKVGFEYMNLSYSYNEKRKLSNQGPVYLIMVGNTLTELHRLNATDLRIERNHIFAKYGYKFKSEDLALYYSMMDWYKPRYDNVDTKVTEEDKALIAYIQKLEK